MREEFQYSNFSKYSHKHPDETINEVIQQVVLVARVVQILHGIVVEITRQIGGNGARSECS